MFTWAYIPRSMTASEELSCGVQLPQAAESTHNVPSVFLAFENARKEVPRLVADGGRELTGARDLGQHVGAIAIFAAVRVVATCSTSGVGRAGVGLAHGRVPVRVVGATIGGRAGLRPDGSSQRVVGVVRARCVRARMFDMLAVRLYRTWPRQTSLGNRFSSQICCAMTPALPSMSCRL